MLRSRTSRPSARLPILLILLAALLPLGAQERGLAVTLKRLTGDDSKPGRQIAVFIAVDKYKEWPVLKNPVKDAKEIREILQRRYWVDQVIELYDEQATRAGIVKLFNQLVATTQPDDSVLIFYAGHGNLERASNSAFWIPVDGGVDQSAQDNWINNSQIVGYINNMKSRHIALVADSCFSGDILSLSRGAMPTIDEEYARRSYSLVSRQVMTSGASETVDDASSFAKQLKLVLEGNKSAYLEPMTIYDQVRRGVSGQTPLLGTLKSAGHQEGGGFLFFLRDAPATAAAYVPPAGSGELMVRASVAGAEVFVDGVSRGKAPLLVKKLEAGKALKIEARSGMLSGLAEVTLKDGELRELDLALVRMTGNLLVVASEKELTVWLDGSALGALGGGIFRGIPAGDHRLELKGPGLYYSGQASVPANETGRVDALVKAVGRLEVSAPADATIRFSGPGLSWAATGNSVLENAPVGPYKLTAEGPGYTLAVKNITVAKGETLVWLPYTTGTLYFEVSPGDATYSLDGRAAGTAAGRSGDISPGNHSVLIRRPGYLDYAQTVSVAAGKSAKIAAVLQPLAPATLVLPAFPGGLGASLEGRALASSEAEGGLAFAGLPSGQAISLRFEYPYSDELEKAGLDAVFEAGQRVGADMPSGRFTLPWLPQGSAVSIGQAAVLELPASSGEGFASPELPAGAYTLKVSGPRPYAGRVIVAAGATVEPEGYRGAMLSALSGDRSAFSAKAKSKAMKTTFGWVSLGTGLAGGIASGLVYALGNAAMADYLAAADTASAVEARQRVDLYGTLFPVAASIGGLGLGLSPVLLLGGPDPKALQRSIEGLDDQIKALQK
jgi:hypothetical protein